MDFFTPALWETAEQRCRDSPAVTARKVEHRRQERESKAETAQSISLIQRRSTGDRRATAVAVLFFVILV